MLNIKPFRQKINYCGPAALKMVLSYYGIEKTEEELAGLAGCTADQGASAQQLISAAKNLGLQGIIKDKASLTEIKACVVDKKIPVIVDWFWQDDGHYSVVVDIDQENIHLLDPGLGHLRAMRLKDFYRVWFDFPGDCIKNKNELILRRMIVIYSSLITLPKI